MIRNVLSVAANFAVASNRLAVSSVLRVSRRFQVSVAIENQTLKKRKK